MLINALCDYYDILAQKGIVLPDGYSNVKIHYLVSLTDEGEIDEIINYQEKVRLKNKIKFTPRDVVMPKRTEKPGIDANIIEHRPLYLFGLNLEGEILTPNDRTNKAKKSHMEFVKANLKFIEDLESPLINAYRKFIQNWSAIEEVNNKHLLALGKDYCKAGFIFCRSGYPEKLLHEKQEIKKRWETFNLNKIREESKTFISQCAVEGENAPIARIHSKIKGIYGGHATGSVLIGFNNPSENSYGNEQSYNSNISEITMKKYTESLNYLLNCKQHKILLDDMTILFWAMNSNTDCESKFLAMLMGQSEKLDTDQVDRMLQSLMKDVKTGNINENGLQSLDMIDNDVVFYMVGLKPNSSRIAVKFFFRKQFSEILWNIVQYQLDIQISEDSKTVPLWQIKNELISPKSKNEKINPALLAKIFEAVIYGNKYPYALLETVVRRVKLDTDIKVSGIRAGIIKACINRNYFKEELKVALDKENGQQAYLCGRLFAVLEKVQQEASSNSLNRTIKDAYFASASSKPAIIFPKLIKLSQNHLNKVKYPIFYNKLIGEILEKLDGEFPETLLLIDQGKFIVGYYHQYQDFFKKNED